MTRFAEDNGFRLTDIRMTLGRSLPADIVEGAGIRMARPSDHSPMKRLAAKSFTDSRFFHDEHFSNVKCEELYSTWLERSCDGYAERVFIAECSGLPAGFITCSLGAAEGVIGLLAVDGDFQSRGIGRALVTAALNYFREQGMTRARVVTQGSNLRSQRLYQRCGFVTEQVQLWYHRWFTLHKATAANPQRGTGLT
jgi:ribosomal protein S18 acetylase RimI-like enzyme